MSEAGTNLLVYSNEQKRRNYDAPANVRSYSESRIRDFVMHRCWEARQGKVYQNLKSNYDAYRRAYDGKFKYNQNIPKWRNRLFVRLAFKIVETLRAYFDDAIFGRDPFVMVSPQDVMFKNAARNMEALMQHEALLAKKRLKYMYATNYALKFGLGVTRNFWNFERGIRPVRQFVRNGQFLQAYKEVEREYVRKDRPDFLVIDPIKVAPDPLNWLTDDMRYVVEEMEVDFDALYNKRKSLELTNLGALEDDLRGGYPATSHLTGFGASPHNQADYQGTLAEQERRSFDYTRKRVSILRYEGKLDMPGNQEDPRFYEVWLANDKHVIMLRRNPYSFDSVSYNFHSIIPKEDSYVGIGAIEPILTDQRILNILCNIRLDSLHLLISPRILAHMNSFERGIDNINNVYPGGIIKVKSMQDITRAIMPLNMPDQGFNTFHQFWQMQNQHAEETLAMHPNARGMLAQQKRSATETVRSLEAANARFLNMVGAFAETGYEDHCKKESSLIQQLMEKGKRVKITGDPKAGDIYEYLKPWDIQGDFMFKRQDPTKANKETEAQLWANLLNVFAPYFQMLAPYGVTPIPFLKGVLESSPVFNKLDIAKSLPETSPQADEFLNNENPSLEQAFAMAANQGTQPGGGMAPGTPPLSTPQPEGTTMGIAMRGM